MLDVVCAHILVVESANREPVRLAIIACSMYLLVLGKAQTAKLGTGMTSFWGGIFNQVL